MNRKQFAAWLLIFKLIWLLGGDAYGETVLLDFTAKWCGPCQQMQPDVDALKSQGYPIRQVNVDTFPTIKAHYGVTAMPTLIVIVDGRPTQRVEGRQDRITLARLIEETGWRAAAQKPDESAVRVTYQLRGRQCLGTGTLVARDKTSGLVITCSHTFDLATGGQASVKCSDGKTYPAKILGQDKINDLAALEIARPDCRPLQIAAKDPQTGDLLTSGGFGHDGLWMTNRGQATGLVTIRERPGSEAIEMRGLAWQGDSGGPVFNEQGELAGVLFGTDTHKIDLCCAGRVRRFLQRFRPKSLASGTLTPVPIRPSPTQPAPAAGNPAQQPDPHIEPGEPAGTPAPAVPPANEPAGTPANELDPRIESLEKRLADAEKQRLDLEARANEDKRTLAAKLHNQVQALEDKLSAAKEKLKAQAEERLTGGEKTPLDSAAQAVAAKGLTAVLTPWLGPAAGIAGTALAGIFGTLWIRGRSKLRERLEYHHGNSDGPPTVRVVHAEPVPPAADVVEERHFNHFVRVPESTTDKAWAKAHEIYCNYYPGAFNTLKAVEKLKNQILKGEPHDYNAPRAGGAS